MAGGIVFAASGGAVSGAVRAGGIVLVADGAVFVAGGIVFAAAFAGETVGAGGTVSGVTVPGRTVAGGLVEDGIVLAAGDVD